MIDINRIPDEAFQVLKNLKTNGYESYFVGGAIRDLLLGRQPKDFDICTAATPDQVKEIFKKVIDTGLKFGTVTVLVMNRSIEVTTFRKSADFINGERRGVVGFGDSPEEDVKARDFTINSLLFDGDKVIDLVGGLADLSERKLRAIGVPVERFNEDALRMMRGIRHSCQLEFNIEDNTLQAICHCAGLIQKISQERVRDELVKILISELPSTGVRLLQETGMLKFLIPELDACSKFEQRNSYHNKDVFEHILAVLENTPNDLVLRLAALFHDIAKPCTLSIDDKGVGHFYNHNIVGQKMSQQIMRTLKFDNKTTQSVGILIREHMNKLQNPRLSTVKRLIQRTGVENIGRLIDLQIADEAGSAPPHNFEPFEALREKVRCIIDRGDPINIGDLAIGGQDLMTMGFSRGPEIGRVLKQLLKYVIDNPQFNTKEKLLEFAMMIKSEVDDRQEVPSTDQIEH